METWSDPASTTVPGASRKSATDGLGYALDAVLQALSNPTESLDRLRGVVVRYGAQARDQAMQLEEMLSTLTRGLRDALEAFPTPRQAEVLAFVQWWAVHGYHRAD